jgi:diguanylate cyclase (GGDEF)-like protein
LPYRHTPAKRRLDAENLACPETKRFNQRFLKYFRSQPEAFEDWEIESDATPPRMMLFRPSLPNNSHCLRCHGDPKQAPKGLVKIYGTDHGFHEPIGWIRGISVYEVNLTQDLSRFHHLMAGIAMALFLLLATIYVVVLWVHGKLQKDQQIILQQKEALYKLANQDALTGLFNRHKLESDLPKLLEALRQERLISLAAVLLDIDHFKRFNDTYGHDVGDLVLQALAQGLKAHCKEASPYFYRLGGEEFLVLLPNIDKQTAVERVLQCQKDLPHAIEGVETPLTYSIGVAWAETGDTPQTLLKKADLALYYVKENGRNNVHLFDSGTLSA